MNGVPTQARDKPPCWDPSKHWSFPEDKEHIWAQELGVLTGVFATYLLLIFFFFQESS